MLVALNILVFYIVLGGFLLIICETSEHREDTKFLGKFWGGDKIVHIYKLISLFPLVKGNLAVKIGVEGVKMSTFTM